MELSRREMLGALGGMAAGAAIMTTAGAKAAHAAEAAPAPKNYPVIDFRVRAPYAGYAGYKNANWDGPPVMYSPQYKTGWPSPESIRQFSMPLLIKEADEAGIAKMVVPVRIGNKGKNEDVVDLINQYPDRIIGLAGIDVSNIKNAIAETEKFVVNGPLKGIVLEPGMDPMPWMCNSPRVVPLYEFCQEKGVPIAMSYGGIMVPELKFYDPYALDWVLGAFPKLQICICHGGWPFVTEVCQMVINRGNLWVAPDFYFMRTPGDRDYVTMASYAGRERMIFASGYPLVAMGPAKEAYENSGVVPEALPYLMGGNAARFLKIQL